MIRGIMDMIKLRRREKLWRKINSENNTTFSGHSDFNRISVGKYTYGNVDVLNFSNQYNLTIGSYVSIGPEVHFLVCSEHPLNTISTFPFKVIMLQSEQFEALSKGDIIVDDDVWIGHSAIILSNVHIGQGAVVAAGSVVTKDVPAYAIVAGNPARLIKYRFDNDIRERLMQLDFSRLTREFVEAHLEDLYRPIEALDDLDFLNTLEVEQRSNETEKPEDQLGL